MRPADGPRAAFPFVFLFALLCTSGAAIASENPGDSLLPDFYNDPSITDSQISLEDYEKSEVDVFSGMMSRQSVDLSLPGPGGMTIQVQRSYRSLQPYVLPERTAVGAGWQMHFGWLEITDAAKMCSPLWSVSVMDNPIIHMPDGSVDVLAMTNAGMTAMIDPTRVHYRSKGGLGIICGLPAYPAPGQPPFIMVDGSGRQYEFREWSSGGAVAGFYRTAKYYVSRITDSHGNSLSIETADVAGAGGGVIAPVRVSASDGRVVTFSYSGTRLQEIRVGSRVVAQYEHEDSGLGSSYSTLTSVELGGTLTWSYEYGSRSGSSSGSIETVTNPFGGVTTYSWARLFFQAVDEQELNSAVTSVTQTASIGPARIWSYSYNPSEGADEPYDRTSVSAPEGSYTYVHHSALGMVSGGVWKVGLKHSVSFTPNGGGGTRHESYSWEPWAISGENYKRTKMTGVYAAVDQSYYLPLLSSQRITVGDDTWTISNSAWYVPPVGPSVPQIVAYTGPDGSRLEKNYRYFSNASSFMYGLPAQEFIEQAAHPGYTPFHTTYNANGDAIARYERGVWTHMTYDAAGNMTSSTVGLDADGQNGTPRTTYYANHFLGQPRTTTYPDGTVSTRDIDSLGRVTRITDREGKTRRYTHDGVGRVTSIDHPQGNDVDVTYLSRTTRTVRGDYRQEKITDGFGQLVEETHEDVVSGRALTVRRTYDNRGRVTFTSYPNSTAGVRYHYDGHNRIVRVVHPGGERRYDYLPGGRVEQQDENGNLTVIQRRETEGLGKGEIVRIDSPEGIVTRIERNEYGLPLRIEQGNGTDFLVRTNTYSSYLVLMASHEPESGEAVYNYDFAGNLRYIGRRETPSSPWYEQWNIYDVNERLQTVWAAQQTVPSGISPGAQARFGVRMDFTYTPEGKPLLQQRQEGIDHLTANGTLITSEARSSAWTHLYDDNGNLLRETATVGNRAWSFNYAYDGNDRLALLTYPDGAQVDYAPDAFGWPTRAGSHADQVWYHPSGQLGGFRYGNGQVMQIGLDARWLVSGIDVPGIVGLAYDYDATGNVIAVTDTRDASASVTLGYDGMNRLVSAAGPWGTGTFAYDALGNITAKQIGDEALTLGYDGRNRLLSVSGSRTHQYAYDNFGNIAARDALRFGYDSLGNLMSAHAPDGMIAVDYQYDARGRRIMERRDGLNRYVLNSTSDQLLYEDAPYHFESTRHVHVGRMQVARVETYIDCSDDIDGDGIPHCVEQTAGLDPFDPLDALGDRDGDGISNIDEYLAGTNIARADTDGDGMPDGIELSFGFDPLRDDGGEDADQDGLPNAVEVIRGFDPRNAVDGQADVDGDGLSAASEYALGTAWNNPDTDGDGMGDGYEVARGLDPRINDRALDLDGDGMKNGWEFDHGFDPASPADAALDADDDGLSNREEHDAGTDPRNADTDGDGMGDAYEISHGLNPRANDRTGDRDGDGLDNWREFQLGTNPALADSDGDGMTDGFEVLHAFDPLSAADAALDADGDGLSNLEEAQYGLNPRSSNITTDADGDGLPDVWEIRNGLDPNNRADAALDPDGDGMSTLYEYHRGTNPFVADRMPAVDDVWVASGETDNRVAWAPHVLAQNYTVEYGVLGDAVTSQGDVGTLSSFTHGSLQPGTLYGYRVLARGPDGVVLPGRQVVAIPGVRSHHVVPATLAVSCESTRLLPIAGSDFLFLCASGEELAVSRLVRGQVQSVTRFVIGRDAVLRGHWDADAGWRGGAVLAWLDRGDTGDRHVRDELLVAHLDVATGTWLEPVAIEQLLPTGDGVSGYFNSVSAFDAVLLPDGRSQVYYALRLQGEDLAPYVEIRRAYDTRQGMNVPLTLARMDVQDVRSVTYNAGGDSSDGVVVTTAAGDTYSIWSRFTPPPFPGLPPSYEYAQKLLWSGQDAGEDMKLDVDRLFSVRAETRAGGRLIRYADNCSYCMTTPQAGSWTAAAAPVAAYGVRQAGVPAVLWPVAGGILRTQWQAGTGNWSVPALLVQDAGLTDVLAPRLVRSYPADLLYWMSGSTLRTLRLRTDGTWTAPESLGTPGQLSALGVDTQSGNAVVALRQPGQYVFREYRPRPAHEDLTADTTPPVITRTGTRSGTKTIQHVITLSADEPANIFFQVSGGTIVSGGGATTAEQRYTGPVTITFAKGKSAVLSYRAINAATRWSAPVSVVLQ